LVDDDTLVADGFRMLLELEPDIRVVGMAQDGEAAIVLVQQHHPDVVVMDVKMDVLDGVAATRRLRALDPGCNILLLTTYNDDGYVRDGIQAGAHGYLLKRAARTELVDAVREIARGGTVIHRDVLPSMFKVIQQGPGGEGVGLPVLTPRERDVLQELAKGSTNKEIAERLIVSDSTVKSHVDRILSKFGVNSRQEAVAAARRHGVMAPN
jgi:DNA-binding NarL/FixJ family response regulator